MKFPYTKNERRDARMMKQQRAMRTAAAIARTIASCEHDFSKGAVLCRTCGCNRPRQP